MKRPGYMPTVEERVEWHLEDGTDTLYVCPDAWALRHRFIHREIGKARRARCDRWLRYLFGCRQLGQPHGTFARERMQHRKCGETQSFHRG